MSADIMVVSSYRSGSNHISDSLANLIGATRTFLSGTREGWCGDNQRIDLAAANALWQRLHGIVYLQHIFATEHNLGVIRALDPSPFVIVAQRRLIPSLHSLRGYADRMIEDGRAKSIPNLPPDWGDLNNYSKWMWIAYTTIPWYYQFYVSWNRAEYPVHFVWYKEHFRDQIASVKKMLQFLGVPDGTFSDEQIKASFFHKNSNFTDVKPKFDIPQEVYDLAYDQSYSWGEHWGSKIREDLL